MKHPSQYDTCPDCSGEKTRISSRCRACSFAARRLPAADLAVRRQQSRRRYYELHRDEIIAKKVAAGRANPGPVRARGHRYGQRHAAERDVRVAKWVEANPERSRAIKRRWLEKNPGLRKEVVRRSRVKAGSRYPEQVRRRARKAGILLTVKVESDCCGVCSESLSVGLVYPDPQATTVGHEPPLAVATRDGWTVVVERPEHAVCNWRKGIRTDAEMVAWRS